MSSSCSSMRCVFHSRYTPRTRLVIGVVAAVAVGDGALEPLAQRADELVGDLVAHGDAAARRGRGRCRRPPPTDAAPASDRGDSSAVMASP